MQGAEGQRSGSLRRRRRFQRQVRRPQIAAKNIGQTHQLLGVNCGFSGWVGHGIDDSIIDRLKPGGSRVAKIADLNGGRLAGEKLQTIVTHVAGQIHQDVDLVLTNTVQERLMRHVDRLPPLVSAGLQMLGHSVGSSDIRIAKGFHLTAIMMGQDRLHKIGYGMEAKIRRKIADPQSTVRVGRIVMNRPSRGGRCMPLRPADMLRQKRGAVHLGIAIHGAEQRAVRDWIGGIESHGLLKILPRLDDVSLRLQGQAQVVSRHGEVWR